MSGKKRTTSCIIPSEIHRLQPLSAQGHWERCPALTEIYSTVGSRLALWQISIIPGRSGGLPPPARPDPTTQGPPPQGPVTRVNRAIRNGTFPLASGPASARVCWFAAGGVSALACRCPNVAAA